MQSIKGHDSHLCQQCTHSLDIDIGFTAWENVTYDKWAWWWLKRSACTATVYRIYPKYSDISTPYHICSKIWTSTIHYPILCLKIAGWVANSVDPDETPRSAASHLGQNCLLRPVCPNTYGKYGTHSSLSWIKKALILLNPRSSSQRVRRKHGYTSWFESS